MVWSTLCQGDWRNHTILKIMVGNVLGGKGSDAGEARQVSRGQAHPLEEMRIDVGEGHQSCSG